MTVENAERTQRQKRVVHSIILSMLSVLALACMWFASFTPALAASSPSSRSIPAHTAVRNAAPPTFIVYVHRATAANSVGNWTILNNPVTNNNPNAIVFVTPNWNPGGVGGVYDNHAIGVWYTGTRWAIFNQDLTPIPNGASFNVTAYNDAKSF
jgi:hypothetical protein